MRRVAVIVILVVALLVTWFIWQPGLPPSGTGAVSPVDLETSAPVEIRSPDHRQSDDEDPIAPEPDCPPADGELPSSTDVHDKVQAAAAALKTSGDPELRLAAGIFLMFEDPESAFDLMQQVPDTSPSAALASWRLLNLCSQRDLPACESTTVEENAIRADRGNGMMWVQVASRRLKSGREQEAIDAIRNAIAAPRFDTYFTDQIAVIDRGLAAVSSWSFAERVVHGSDNVAVSPGDFGFIRQRCGDAMEGVWSELCDQLGQRMVSENIDLQTRILGSGLRIDVLANIGDLRGAAAAEQKKEKLQAQQNMLGEDVSFLNLILSDDNVLRDYLSNSEAYGEQEAILRLSEHVERLRTTPGYNQCNFLTNPYIKL